MTHVAEHNEEEKKSLNFIEMAEERSHPNTAIINMRDADKEIESSVSARA